MSVDPKQVDSCSRYPERSKLDCNCRGHFGMPNYLGIVRICLRCSRLVLTESESEHIGQGPRSIVDDVKLACLEENEPYSSARAESPLDAFSKSYQEYCVDQSESTSSCFPLAPTSYARETSYRAIATARAMKSSQQKVSKLRSKVMHRQTFWEHFRETKCGHSSP